MSRRIVSGIILLVLLLGMSTFAVQLVESDPATITVPDNYLTIQEAINNADNGDTIFVRNGTYYEHVVVDREISLVAESSGETIIDGNGTGRVVILNSTGVVLDNFVVRNSGPGPCGRSYGCIYLGVNCSNSLIVNNVITNGSGGVEMTGSSNNTLESNILSNCDYGFELKHADQNRIWNNTIIENGNGISFMSDCNNNSVISNIFTGNTGGIFLYRSPFNVFRENILANNKYNMRNEASFSHSITEFDQSIDESNIINGKPIVYLVGKEDVLISPATYPSGVGYLGIVRSKNITIQHLDISNVWEGVFLAYTTNSSIHNITASHIYTGVFLINSTFIEVSNCQFSSTSSSWGNALWLKASHNNFIHDNNISKIGSGVNLYASSNNTITNNVIFNCVGGIWTTYDNPNNTVTYNDITQCSIGISFDGSGNTIIGNRVTHCELLGVEPGSYAVVAHNTLTDNGIGVFIQMDQFNRIYENIIMSNDHGFKIRYCSNNLFYNNAVCNNSVQVHTDDTSNMWDLNQQGNYWSDYNGTDLDSDGIGDSPYSIDENNQDNYPLMKPSNPLFCDMNCDFKIDMRDIALVAFAYGSDPTHPRWNPVADINQDNKVDMRDIALVARHFGK